MKPEGLIASRFFGSGRIVFCSDPAGARDLGEANFPRESLDRAALLVDRDEGRQTGRSRLEFGVHRLDGVEARDVGCKIHDAADAALGDLLAQRLDRLVADAVALEADDHHLPRHLFERSGESRGGRGQSNGERQGESGKTGQRQGNTYR